MSYKEPGYHKPGDPPFSFPPEEVDSKVDANLIDIEGRNGTGKTTLLNCMALAMGYIDLEEELRSKPALRKKLQALEKNKTLEYYFKISCGKPEPTELVIKREEGKEPQWWLNSKRVDRDALDKKFDLVFLTEDDPRKVVSASLGKLAGYFGTLEKELASLQSLLNKRLISISEYHDFKKKEKETLDEIVKLKKNIEKNNGKLSEFQNMLKKIEEKIEIKEKLELLNNEERITSDYKSLKKKYEGLKDKTGTKIVRKLYKERYKLKLADDKRKEIDARIVQTCQSLAHHGLPMDSEKLLAGDYSEFNRLNRKIQPQKQRESVKLQMIDEMIELFRNYLANDIVPIIEKPVGEVLDELFKMKVKLASDRIFGLFTALTNTLEERKDVLTTIDKIQEKIRLLARKAKDLEDIGDIRISYVEAERKYANLQIVLAEGRAKLLSQWKKLRSIKGDPIVVKNKIQELNVLVKAEETMRSKYSENLKLLRENAARKPKYEKKEKRLQSLNGEISRLREDVFQWTQILHNPQAAKEQFESRPRAEGPGFGLSEYRKFVRAVGEYLGNQFEPIAFDYKLHQIEFFDIERGTFTTKEDREIPIDNLSQGQSKIATLTGSFKKMDPGKKKIVLIDEIADLDPENLQKVKTALKEKFAEGLLILAILVRPPRESSTKIIDIRGWG